MGAGAGGVPILCIQYPMFRGVVGRREVKRVLGMILVWGLGRKRGKEVQGRCSGGGLFLWG